MSELKNIRLIETPSQYPLAAGERREARTLPERPAAQSAATGLCLFQSAASFSPALRDAGSIHIGRDLWGGGSWFVTCG